MDVACVSQLTAGRDGVNCGTSELHSWALSFTLCLSIYLLLSPCPPALRELAVDEGGLFSLRHRGTAGRQREGRWFQEKTKERKVANVLKDP